MKAHHTSNTHSTAAAFTPSHYSLPITQVSKVLIVHIVVTMSDWIAQSHCFHNVPNPYNYYLLRRIQQCPTWLLKSGWCLLSALCPLSPPNVSLGPTQHSRHGDIGLRLQVQNITCFPTFFRASCSGVMLLSSSKAWGNTISTPLTERMITTNLPCYMQLPIQAYPIYQRVLLIEQACFKVSMATIPW